ncbi:hypothetical protein NDU88_001032 [Pleurodeles waltl]|uniref:Uncharacterized protein n=1 Tax=Pleurodeles waltl TaxID=8319 RepID=A0AAV7N9V2_PLEWA|nr:hypothetical protein NDU88_001032 [Pleurodeles waltl]
MHQHGDTAQAGAGPQFPCVSEAPRRMRFTAGQGRTPHLFSGITAAVWVRLFGAPISSVRALPAALISALQQQPLQAGQVVFRRDTSSSPLPSFIVQDGHAACQMQFYCLLRLGEAAVKFPGVSRQQLSELWGLIRPVSLVLQQG